MMSGAQHNEDDWLDDTQAPGEVAWWLVACGMALGGAVLFVVCNLGIVALVAINALRWVGR
jgi:hypothetical protein